MTDRAVSTPERDIFAVPDKAAIEYGRRVVQQLHDKLKGWEQKANAEGDAEKARRLRFAAFMLKHDLLGSDEGGSVITAFDLRWLDDTFRGLMGQVRRSIAADRAGESRD